MGLLVVVSFGVPLAATGLQQGACRGYGTSHDRLIETGAVEVPVPSHERSRGGGFSPTISVRQNKTAGRSRAHNEQRLHVCATCHQGIRWLEVLAQFPLPDERARNDKSILHAFSDGCRSASFLDHGDLRQSPAAIAR